jgi:hypothetical protein
MSRFNSRPWLLLAAVALLAAPASADVFYVTLTNGSVIETGHQPQQAAWDPTMILLLTESGNWVGFPQSDIQGIRQEDPTQGYGIRISDKTIDLGRSPNDLPEAGSKNRQEDLNDRLYALSERMLQQAESRQNYSVEQFVEPGQSQGIPSSFGGYFNGVNSDGIGQLPIATPRVQAPPSGGEAPMSPPKQ